MEFAPELEEDRLRVAPERGRARGLELFLAREPRGGHTRWSASYALASAEDRVGGVAVPRLEDHRHTLQLEVGYRPSPALNLSAAWIVRSGKPVFYPLFQRDTAPEGGVRMVPQYAVGQVERMPAYHRLDVRATRSFRVAGGSLDVFLDVFNLYGRDNLRGWDYYPIGRGDARHLLGRERLEPVMGLLPTFGFRWGF